MRCAVFWKTFAGNRVAAEIDPASAFGTFRTSPVLGAMSASEGKAEVALEGREDRLCPAGNYAQEHFTPSGKLIVRITMPRASMRTDMRRREFLGIFGGVAAAWPVAVRAQSAKRPLVAWLGTGSRTASSGFVDAFLQGMRDLGYVEGRDFDIVYRVADGYAERLHALAEELVRLRPNVILAAATGPAVAAKKATATIPIVVPALADAIHLGLIASEARPGGNVTGITPYVAGLPAKQLELAREVVPDAGKSESLVTSTTQRLRPSGGSCRLPGWPRD